MTTLVLCNLGARDVYLMPAMGGEPERLTFHGGTDQVIDWHPDGRRVLFAYCKHYPNLHKEPDKLDKGNVPEDAFYHLFEMNLDGSGLRLEGGTQSGLTLAWDQIDPEKTRTETTRESRFTVRWLLFALFAERRPNRMLGCEDSML